MAHRSSSNRSTALSRLGLVLSAIYLNLILDSVKGSDHHSHGGGGYYPPMVISPQMYPQVMPSPAIGGFGGFRNLADVGGFYNQGGNNGYNNNGGFYDDLFAQRNAYDVGNGFGNGYDYGKGSVLGGGYRGLKGKNKGHTASGFSNSYKKDESGDRSSYYDDGLGHQGSLNYGAQDARFRDQGGQLGRGGYHNTNLNRYGTGGRGRYGDSLIYSRGGNAGGQLTEGGYGFRNGRLIQPHKKTGLYLIPMPDRLFFDQTPAPL